MTASTTSKRRAARVVPLGDVGGGTIDTVIGADDRRALAGDYVEFGTPGDEAGSTPSTPPTMRTGALADLQTSKAPLTDPIPVQKDTSPVLGNSPGSSDGQLVTNLRASKDWMAYFNTLDRNINELIDTVSQILLDPHIHNYAPGSFTIPAGSFAVMVKHLILSGTEEAVLEGNARLEIL
jgi:hypothetical protein